MEISKKTFFDYPTFENVKDIIYDAVKKYPQNIAFKIKDKSNEEVKYIDITYKEFLEDVNNFGTALYSLRIRKE